MYSTISTNNNNRCLQWSLVIILIIIIIIIIIILVIIGIWRKIKYNFLKNWKISYIEYCKSIEPNVSNYPISKPNKNGIYEYPLAKSLLDVAIDVTNSNCLNKPSVPIPIGFVYQEKIYGYDKKNKRRMYATIFISASAIKFLIAFTGTFTLDEWADDFTYPLVNAIQLNNYENGIQVHKGFYEVYIQIRQQIWNLYNKFKDKIKEIYITGHSLGGALSTICAFDFAMYKPIHYSFAAPRSGGIKYAQKFNKIVPTSLRILNVEDNVPHLPPSVFFQYKYQHTNTPIMFDVNLGTINDNHIKAYLDYLPKCIPNIAPCNI